MSVPPPSSSSSLSAVPTWDEADGYVIKWPRSDGVSARRPTKLDPTPKDGMVDYMVPFDMNHPRSLHWRKAIGRHIAEHVMNRTDLENPWIIEDFPEGYALFDHLKGKVNGELRHDAYLFGSRKVDKFRSPNEFYLHAQWLFFNEDLDAVQCTCKWCGKGNQSVINMIYGGTFRSTSTSPQLSRIRARPPKPVTPAKKAARGRKSLPGLSSSRISAAVMPSSDRAVRSPSPSMPSPPRTPPPLRPREPMNHLRDGDIRVSHKPRSRVGELVWCRLRPPIQGAEVWQCIELWPGIVEETGHRLDPSSPSQRGVWMPYLHVDTRRMHLLGVSQKIVIPESEICPYLAYDVPQRLNEWLGSQSNPGMPMSADLRELQIFRPYIEPTVANVIQSPVEPPNFDEAWPSFLLALVMARDISCTWHSTDPFSVDPSYTTPLSTPANTNTNTNDNDREESPMQVYTRYQGIWWGSERIWQDDVVRLSLTRSRLGLTEAPNDGASSGDVEEHALLLRIDQLWTEFHGSTGFTYAGGAVYELTPVDESADSASGAEETNVPVHGSVGVTRLSRAMPLISAPPLSANGPPAAPGFIFNSVLEEGKQLEMSLAGLAGRYYPHLHTSPLNDILNDPERNSVQPEMLQSLGGRVPGAVRPMCPKNAAHGRVAAVEEFERTRKAELAEKWGLIEATSVDEVAPMEVEVAPMEVEVAPPLDVEVAPLLKFNSS